MTSHRILIVDDEPELRSMLRQYLSREGFDVAESSTGAAALDTVARSEPDLVLLDVGLPDIDGFEVLRSLRSTSDIPVIMLTARDDEIDRVVGLSVGADDYVVKPFSPRELVARIQAVLRRGAGGTRRADATLRFAGLTIDVASREVHSEAEIIKLSALEFDLLVALAQRPNRVFTRQQLLERVWGFDYFGVERVIDVHVANIRKALGDDAADPRYIGTVRGVGYKFIGELE
ncbi:MAG: response regulator transcription factor [Actinomycetota bacterium]|nr:response regulator transcription factor [Actinomycetota bacterium]